MVCNELNLEALFGFVFTKNHTVPYGICRNLYRIVLFFIQYQHLFHLNILSTMQTTIALLVVSTVAVAVVNGEKCSAKKSGGTDNFCGEGKVFDSAKDDEVCKAACTTQECEGGATCKGSAETPNDVATCCKNAPASASSSAELPACSKTDGSVVPWTTSDAPTAPCACGVSGLCSQGSTCTAATNKCGCTPRYVQQK